MVKKGLSFFIYFYGLPVVDVPPDVVVVGEAVVVPPAESSLVIVTTCGFVPVIATPPYCEVALDKVTLKVSLPATVLSPVIVIVIFAELTPLAKFKVPLAAV